jgi:monoamine oxidase
VAAFLDAGSAAALPARSPPRNPAPAAALSAAHGANFDRCLAVARGPRSTTTAGPSPPGYRRVFKDGLPRTRTASAEKVPVTTARTRTTSRPAARPSSTEC